MRYERNNLQRPFYPHHGIQSVVALSRALRVPEESIRSIAERSQDLYIGPKPKLKKNGDGFRLVYDTKPPLKRLLETLNNVFFKKVEYPEFLTGSLPGCDFVRSVSVHVGAKRVITEDIERFFDNITSQAVYRIWLDFFHFEEEVARLLTAITTKDGYVFQGTPTSSYLANLVFWNREHFLVARLNARGVRYTRYLDDITLSSTSRWSKEDGQEMIALVYGMMRAAGLKPKRNKHQILNSSQPITIMGLNVNDKLHATLPKKERSQIRSAVFEIERCVTRPLDYMERKELHSLVSRTNGRVGRLKRLHPVEGTALQKRVQEAMCCIG